MTEQKSGRRNQLAPDPANLPTDSLDHLLPTVTLKCLDAECAQRVVAEFPNRDRGGRANTMKAEGDTVVITYGDKMWPYDIADWAGGTGLASDSDSARVFACL